MSGPFRYGPYGESMCPVCERHGYMVSSSILEPDAASVRRGVFFAVAIAMLAMGAAYIAL